jgi:uncharacterized protein
MGVNEILFPGCASGPLLRLTEPLSFWGGVDPSTGSITQVRHPQCGLNIAGTVLALPGTIGSSSSSAVLLELIRAGSAPAALLLAEADAILLIGCIVAREMGWAAPPALRVSHEQQQKMTLGQYTIDKTGLLSARP